jgi:hypothetical protein
MEKMQISKNPLAGYMRQPKIYIRLPSDGKYWPKNSIVIPENEEFPVYSMTAKDELTFKTPDALMNGQAMVDVIQSCLPNIKNAWECPTLDLDVILIAIRLATYGSNMDITYRVPATNEESAAELDLRILLDRQLAKVIWQEQIIINDELMVFVKPLTYRHLTQTGIKAFETNRILTLVNDESMPEEKKLELFNQSFTKLTNLTVELLAESIYKVITPDAEVTDSRYIKEFVINSDKQLFDLVQKHISEMKLANQLDPLVLYSTPEQVAAGAPESFEIPISFNNSDFFGQGF